MTGHRASKAARSKVTGLAPGSSRNRRPATSTTSPMTDTSAAREQAGRGWPSPMWLRRAIGNQALIVTAPRPATAVETTQDDLSTTVSADIPPGTTADEATQVTEDSLREDHVPDPPDTRLPDEEVLVAVSAPEAATETGFTDLGQVGTVPVGTLVKLGSVAYPRAFVNGGMTGTVVWAGGGGAGAHGNQDAGTIQNEIEPVFVAAAGTVKGKFSSSIGAGTGKADVTRSFVGIASGDQGNGWFVTGAAAARINNHETQHVASSRGIYTANIDPLLTRVANAALGKDAGDSAAAAITAHKAAVNWAPSISAFKTADNDANKPMGTVDTADLASGTYPVNAGPATVAGKAFTSVLRTPAEAMPAP